jgi:hypothetical protein
MAMIWVSLGDRAGVTGVGLDRSLGAQPFLLDGTARRRRRWRVVLMQRGLQSRTIFRQSASPKAVAVGLLRALRGHCGA